MKTLRYLLGASLLLLCGMGLLAENKLFLSVQPKDAASISVVQIGATGQETEIAKNPDGSYTYGNAFTIRVTSTETINVQKWEVNGTVVSDFFGGTYTSSFLTHIDLKSALGVEQLSGTLNVVAYIGKQEYVSLSYGLHEGSPEGSGTVEATEDSFFPNPIASGATIPKGTKVKLKATPNLGYTFGGWYEGGTLVESEKQELSRTIDRDMNFTARFVQKTAPDHPKADLAMTMTLSCQADQRLIFEVSNVEDTIYIDLGDGNPKAFMVSDDPVFAMRIYCDAAVDNPQIKIYAKELYTFKAPSNTIQTIEIVNAPKLKELILFENAISDIDLSSLSSLDRLDLSSNSLTSVNLSNLTGLTYLALGKNNLSEINLNSNKKLQQLKLEENALTALLLQGFTDLETLSVASNKLTQLAIDNCPALTSIDCSNNHLKDLDWKQDLNKLEELYAQNNTLTGLPFIEMPVLETLDLSGNTLRWIDISFLPKLRNFKAIGTKASGALNLTRNPELYSVDVSNNAIETVQCNGLQNLFTIILTHNQIGQLSISDCPRLDEVRCADNQLTNITIQGSPKLTGLDIADNNLDPCALDALYGTLPNRIEEYSSGRIYVASDDTPERENPGATTSKTSIAKSLGWNVYTTRDGLREDFTGDGTGCELMKSQQITMTTMVKVGDKIKLSVETSDGKLEIEGLQGTWENGKTIEYTVSAPTILLKGKITALNCQNCLLTGIDLSKCSQLTSLRCSWNKLQQLDVSHLPLLQELRCSWNELSTLDLSNNKDLRLLFCSQNKLQSLDLHTVPLLESLYGSFNPLGSIDLKDNLKLQVLSLEQTNLESIDISMLPELSYIELSDNALKAIDLSQATGLETLSVKANKLSSIDLKNNVQLVYLDCSKNQLPSIDLSKALKLKKLYCNDNQLLKLNLASLKALEELSCGNNQLTSLDLSPLPALGALSCYGNKLENVDLQYNQGLQSLIIGNNKIRELSLEKNKNIAFIDCFGNAITGKAMTDLMTSLPQRLSDDEASIYIIDGTDQSEENVCLDTDVAIARAKNWIVYDYNGGYDDAKVYAGKETALDFPTNYKASRIYQGQNGSVMVETAPYADIALYDVDGQQILRTTANTKGSAYLDLPQASSGIYVLIIDGESYKLLR